MFKYGTFVEKAKTISTPVKNRENYRQINNTYKTSKSRVSHHKQKSSNVLKLIPNNISISSVDYSNNRLLNMPLNQVQSFENTINEKNILISNLQNQINNYILRENETSKKIELEKQINNSLKEQIKQLKTDLKQKNNMIAQNEDIGNKILKLKRDVEKSREKNPKLGVNDSKNNILLNNKINEYKLLIQEKDEIIKKLKIMNQNLVNKLKNNQLENITIKNYYTDVEGNETNKVDLISYKNMEKQLQNYMNELNQKKYNLNIINDKNKKLISLVNQKNQIIKELKEENEKINLKISNLNQSLKIKNTDLLQHQNMLIEKQKQIKTLTEYLNKVRKEKSSKINNISVKDMNLVKEINFQIISKNSKVKEYEMIIKEQNSKLKEKDDNLNSLRNKFVDSSQEFYKNYENEINKLNIVINKLNNEIKSNNDKFNSSKFNLENNIKDLESNLFLERNNNKNITIENTRYKEENDSLKKQILALTETIDSNQKNMKIKSELLTENKDKINDLEIINDNNDKEIKELKQKILASENENAKLSLLNIDLQNNLDNLNNEIKESKKIIEKNNNEIIGLKEERDEKLLKIEELAKQLNDYEITNKGLTLEKKELLNLGEKHADDIKKKDEEITKLNNEKNNLNDEINRLNIDIKGLNDKIVKYENKIKLFEEEKNNMINNFSEKEKEFNENKEKMIDLNQNMEKVKKELEKEIKEKEKIKKINIELTNEKNKTNLLLKENDDNLKKFEEKYNSLKETMINNENKTHDIEKLIEKNNLSIQEKHDLENQIDKIQTNNKSIIDDILEKKSEIEKNYKETKKENEKLQEKINELSEFQVKSEEKLNSLTLKHIEAKNLLSEKEKELNNLKDISQALIEKDKNKIEQSSKLNPNTCKIISEKKYKSLKWYLIYESNENEGEKNYENYRWVTALIMEKNDIGKFNKYESDENKIKDLEELIISLQKKLEQKEEKFSKLDYQNKKLAKEIHNKTAGNALIRTKKSKEKNKGNTSDEVTSVGLNNIFEELNKNKIDKEKNVENKNENDENAELILAQKQMMVIKKELKDTNYRFGLLSEQVKELLKNVKCDMKNKPQFVQICQLLNISQEATNMLITNNKKGLKI